MRTITVGRSTKCDIIIGGGDTGSVSRIHAEISLVNGQYVYRDVSSNGSNIGGRIYHNERVVVAPGTPILLGGRVPLPWNQVYAQLPLSGVNPFEDETHHYYPPTPAKTDSLGVGWGILAFIIPLAGWIMYFCWREETPKRASQAAMWAWIGFGANVFLYLAQFM